MKEKSKNIILKKNFIHYLKPFLAKHNYKKILIVKGNKSFEKSGASEEIKLLSNDFNFIYFDKFSSNPDFKDALRGSRFFLKEKCDCIISIGGGSVIDMGKLINVFQSHKGMEISLTIGKKKLSKNLKPFVAIPTTSGSGSECTHFAVVYLKEKKYSISHSKLIPDLALVDYCLTLKLSKYQTACSGMDALSQSIESYWAVKSTSESRNYAKKSILLALNNIAKNVNKPTVSSRKNMMIASHLAGKAINITKTTAPHALSYKISQRFNIPHGHAVAITLGYFFELNNSSKNINKQISKVSLRATMKNIYGFFKVRNPKSAKIKWFRLMKEIQLETNFKKLYEKNNPKKLLSNKEINFIIKSVNLERLQNHPVILSNDELISIFKK